MKKQLLSAVSAAALLMSACGTQQPGRQPNTCNGGEITSEQQFDTTGNTIADEPATHPSSSTKLMENYPIVPKLSVKGSALVSDKGDTVQLRGMSYGWHNWHGKYFNESVVHLMAAGWNCKIVRCPIGVGPNNDYLKNPDNAYKCIDNVVNACINEGIYVLIDWHSHYYKLPEAKFFFSKMAQKYGKYNNVLFELFNEPVDQNWDTLKAYGEQCLAEIRKHSDNVVLMGCPKWDQRIEDPMQRPLSNASNLMYTMHFYAGTHKQALRDAMKKAVEHGTPVFLSEYGAMDASGDGALNYEEWEQWIRLADSLKVSWIAWSISAKEETCSILTPDSPEDASLWTDDNIKEYGQACRKLLQGYK